MVWNVAAHWPRFATCEAGKGPACLPCLLSLQAGWLHAFVEAGLHR